MAPGKLPCKIEEAVLNDPSNEESATFDYWVNATGHLLNVLDAEPRLRTSMLHEQLLSLMRFWKRRPSERNNEKALDAIVDLAAFGTVGKALWHLRHKDDPQLRRELNRLATNPESLVGTQYLFYVAGTLAANGYDVDFVPERGTRSQKTPDLHASREGASIWIEANAKQPKRVVDTPERLWQLIRDIIDEKKQKFSDRAYEPGMIVADISTAHHLVNETGTQPLLKLRADLCRPLGSPGGGFLYRLYEDPEWRMQPENQGNVFAFLVDEFAQIDRSKYHVSQCLVTITRQLFREGGQVSLPRGHQLIVHRSAEDAPLLELSRHVYVADSPSESM